MCRHMAVFIPCPDVDRPTGGVQKIYDHVNILNEAGIESFVVHERSPYRAGWFENDTAITYGAVTLRRGDLLAVPEIYGDYLAKVAPGVPRISLNQNAYYTFLRVSNHDRHPYETSPDLLGVVVVSENNRQIVSRLFPHLDVRRIHLAINSQVFYCPEGPRDKVVSYMPRRRTEEIEFVLKMAAPALSGWKLCAIDAMSQIEVGAALRRSALFLSFSLREGLPMPPMEAMASGCYVIGFDGFGGREYFDSRFTSRVEDGDLVAFVDVLQEWLMSWSAEESARRGVEASSYILGHYSRVRERADVLEAYGSFAESAADRWSSSLPSVTVSFPVLSSAPWRLALHRLRVAGSLRFRR